MSYWCCRASFGEHEKTCINHEQNKALQCELEVALTMFIKEQEFRHMIQGSHGTMKKAYMLAKSVMAKAEQRVMEELNGNEATRK